MDTVNRFNHTSWVAIVTRIDRPKSVRNRCVIEGFWSVFVLSLCFLDFYVGVGAFVIGLSQIFSFFSLFFFLNFTISKTIKHWGISDIRGYPVLYMLQPFYM